eukprot:jgi/Psemu1/300112/fgenesh1_kg.6_\
MKFFNPPSYGSRKQGTVRVVMGSSTDAWRVPVGLVVSPVGALSLVRMVQVLPMTSPQSHRILPIEAIGTAQIAQHLHQVKVASRVAVEVEADVLSR